MNKRLLTLAIIFVLQTGFAQLWQPSQINLFSHFNGDRHGDFKGDILVHLTDGSIWKVHPDDRETVSNWGPDEIVHIQLRKSFYWFKREHKFSMLNHFRGESVKVMLIFHGTYPRQIIWTSGPKARKVTYQPVYHTDEKGNRFWVGQREIKSDWYQAIQMDDGSYWEIKGKYDCFKEGTPAFVGNDDQEGDNLPFIIVKNEREAVWTHIYPINNLQ